MSVGSCLVSRLSRYMDLSRSEEAFVAGMQRSEKALGAGQTIVNQGSPSTDIHVLKAGWAIVRSQAVRGRSHITRIYLPGEVIGLGELGPPRAPHSIQMQTDGTVCPFPRTGITGMLTDAPRLSALMMSLASVEQVVLRDQVSALGLMTAEDRLIFFLLQLRARLAVADPDLGNRFHLPFSQAEIGEAVGMTPVYVNKLLRKLGREERLRIERPYVRLLDREGLENQIGFVDRFGEIDQGWFPPAVA